MPYFLSGKSLPFSVPQFPPLKDGGENNDLPHRAHVRTL